MATKKITLKGGQLIDTNNESVGWVADDTSGLHFVADPNVTDAQSAYCTLTHMVTETNNPIWNEVNFKGTYNTTTSGQYEGHITLQGIKPDGTINDLIELYKSTGASTTLTERFELLGSSCTNDSIKQVAGSAAADKISVKLPLRYSKYEDVDLMPSWYDEAWGYRQAIPIERTTGQLHGSVGHYSEYYGITYYVPYTANMSSTTQDDVRFTGPDGTTELPFYQLDVVASTSATYIVMIPWYFLDKETEVGTYRAAGYSHLNPQYIYCYYGNSSATSASDVSLGGQALFYDDFEDDARSEAMWTQVEPANSSVTIENGYLEIRSAASQDSSPYAYADMDFSGSDRTSWEIIWKIIYDTPAYNNTTASNGPYLRIRGRDNTGSGGADETSSYWEVKHFYIAAGAGESTTNIAGHMWGHQSYDSGVLTYGPLYANNIVAAVNDTQYIKFTWNRRDSGYSGNDGVWAQSDDGVNWNTLGDAGAGLTSVFDTVTDLQCAIYYVGKSGVAADKYIRIDSVMAYPVMSGSRQKIHWEESFQNGTYKDRYRDLNVSAGVRYATETQDKIRMGNNAGQTAYFGSATKTAPIVYLGGGMTQPALGDNEQYIYETTVVNFSRTAVAGSGEMGGLILFDNTTLASSNTLIFQCWYRHTGSIRNFRLTTLRAGTVDIDEGFGSWVDADLPIKLRLVVDPKTACVYCDIRRVGTGGSWERIYASTLAYSRNISDTYTFPGLCMRTSTTDASWVEMSKFKMYNGGADIETGKESTTSGWMGEESLADDYPLALTATPGEDDQTITFDVPTPMKRGNAMKVRTKEFGGDYNYSKTFYITNQDLIEIGPSGTDQYIGMRLVFDFSFSSTDTIDYDTIEFLYEVI